VRIPPGGTNYRALNGFHLFLRAEWFGIRSAHLLSEARLGQIAKEERKNGTEKEPEETTSRHPDQAASVDPGPARRVAKRIWDL